MDFDRSAHILHHLWLLPILFLQTWEDLFIQENKHCMEIACKATWTDPTDT